MISEDAAKKGVDWRIWRVALSDKIKDTHQTISTEWTMHQLVDAHLVLDALASFMALDKAGI